MKVCVICFRDHGILREFVCELLPITRINQDFLLAIKCDKYIKVLIELMRQKILH